jgi:hypothetical protein
MGEGEQLVPSYILRDIPADLWRQVKVEAATDGVSVREVILRLLEGYAERNIWPVGPKKDKKERTR